MQNSVDVIIIGAGIAGLCSALQLTRRSRASVLVLEQGRGLGEGSTGASSAIGRHVYTHDPMIELARDGINAYRSWAEFLETESVIARFEQLGLLWLSADPAWCKSSHERLSRFDVPASLLTDADVVSRFPAINPCSLAPDLIHGEAHECRGGAMHLLEETAGYIDPQNVLQDLYDVLKGRGVDIRLATRVSRILVKGQKVVGVETSDGTSWSSGQVVSASGPWCNFLLEPLGLADRWPLQPTRIQMLHLTRPAEVEGRLPVCYDTRSGFYFRPQNLGQQLVTGSTRAEEEQEVVDPRDFDRLAEADFTAIALHALHHRLPALTYRERVTGYAGLYTINRTDVHPLVGKSPIDGLLVANGFSGHGFKLGPAIGSLIARSLTGDSLEDDTRVPLEFLAWDRQPIAVQHKNVLA